MASEEDLMRMRILAWRNLRKAMVQYRVDCQELGYDPGAEMNLAWTVVLRRAAEIHEQYAAFVRGEEAA